MRDLIDQSVVYRCVYVPNISVNSIWIVIAHCWNIASVAAEQESFVILHALR